MLEAYRKLHTGELDEIARGLAELRREVKALTKPSMPIPDWSTQDKVRRTTQPIERARWPSLLRTSG